MQKIPECETVLPVTRVVRAGMMASMGSQFAGVVIGLQIAQVLCTSVDALNLQVPMFLAVLPRHSKWADMPLLPLCSAVQS